MPKKYLIIEIEEDELEVYLLNKKIKRHEIVIVDNVIHDTVFFWKAHLYEKYLFENKKKPEADIVIDDVDLHAWFAELRELSFLGQCKRRDIYEYLKSLGDSYENPKPSFNLVRFRRKEIAEYIRWYYKRNEQHYFDAISALNHIDFSDEKELNKFFDYFEELLWPGRLVVFYMKAGEKKTLNIIAKSLHLPISRIKQMFEDVESTLKQPKAVEKLSKFNSKKYL